MKSLVFSSLAALAFGTSILAQAPASTPAVKVDIKKVNLSEQGTPDVPAGNVTPKRWRPKKWIELDVEFDIKVPQDAGGRNGTYGALQLNVFLALQHTTKDGKREVIRGTLNLSNIPAGETCHALAYVSPASLRAIFQKDNFLATSDVQGWGVEFVADGQRIAGDSSLGKQPWWEKVENFSFIEGVLLAKSESPFALLFGDYDVEAKTK
ncbi:MAG: hypothetical protein RIS79_1709 [Verrucomicrobiota bacterium]|jgi:hypothetical protein